MLEYEMDDEILPVVFARQRRKGGRCLNRPLGRKVERLDAARHLDFDVGDLAVSVNLETDLGLKLALPARVDEGAEPVRCNPVRDDLQVIRERETRYAEWIATAGSGSGSRAPAARPEPQAETARLAALLPRSPCLFARGRSR